MEMRFFLVYVALFTPYAVLTPYLQQLLHLYGFEHDAIGYIQGAVELMGVLAPPVWGLLSDRLRTPRLVLCATILLCIPAILLLKPGQSLAVALGIALLIGFFNKPSISLTDGLTFGHFRRNGCDYGHVRIGGTIGFILSLVLFERVLNISGDTLLKGLNIWDLSNLQILDCHGSGITNLTANYFSFQTLTIPTRNQMCNSASPERQRSLRKP